MGGAAEEAEDADAQCCLEVVMVSVQRFKSFQKYLSWLSFPSLRWLSFPPEPCSPPKSISDSFTGTWGPPINLVLSLSAWGLPRGG